MFREEKVEPISSNSRYLNASEQAKTAVDNSIAKWIGDVIYPNVDEEKFAALFSDDKCSRPNISIRKYVCGLIAERAYNLHDDTFIEFLRSGALNLQYAIHTTDADKQPLCERDLNRFRSKIVAYNKEHHCDLLKEEFKRISENMDEKARSYLRKGVSEPEQDQVANRAFLLRMDSMEIEAHAKVMPRLEILYTTVVIMLRCLVKLNLKALIPEQFDHYFNSDDHNKTMYYKGTDEKRAEYQDSRVASVVSDMDLLEKQLGADVIKKQPEYAVFEKVLEQQTYVTEDGVRHPKDKKDIAPDSIQNPFDVTETYRYKRGPHHGYVLNVVEHTDNHGNGIITDADLRPNTASDNQMAEDYVAALPDDGKVIFDGAYPSDKLRELAEQKNVEISATSLTGKQPDEKVADFKLNEDKTAVLSCPKGEVPTSCSYNPKNGQIRAHMPCDCGECPLKGICYTTGQIKTAEKKDKPLHVVIITAKKVERANAVRQLGSDAAKADARTRNAVEGIMSVLRRKYHLDSIPVFGIDRSSIWVWTSLIAYNVVKYKKAMKRFAA